MAVFVSGSDETEIGGHLGIFWHSGLLAPERDWWEYFAPAWQQCVLDAPPKIPYLHVTDLRDREWQKKYNLELSDAEIDTKLDEAVRIIAQTGSLVAVGSRINAGVFLDCFGKKKIVKMAVSTKPQRLLVDHLAFFGHAATTIGYVAKHHADTEKVDFIVDRKDGVFDRIREYYDTMAESLDSLGDGHLSRFLGELIPGGKDRIPLQAADVALWHVGRSYRPELITQADARRLKRLGRVREYVTQLPDNAVRELARVFKEKLDEQAVSELRRDMKKHKVSAQRNKSQAGGGESNKKAKA